MRYFLFITMILCAFPSDAKKQPEAKKMILQFADAINTHDVKQIAALMTDDHVFVDAMGSEMPGKDKVSAAWDGYFKLYPDYRIEITNIYADGDTVAAFGFAEGSYKGVKQGHWRLPGSWRAVINGGKIRVWQVYADTKMSFDLIAYTSSSQNVIANSSPRATGIGGLFFKCKDSKAVKEWYKQHLHINADKYGAKFEWREGYDSSKYGCTQWSPFGEKTTYFAPSTKDFMINYRVEHLDALVAEFVKDGVTVTDSMQTVSYGKFIHILDCEGNKIELWEPVPTDYNMAVGDSKK